LHAPKPTITSLFVCAPWLGWGEKVSFSHHSAEGRATLSAVGKCMRGINYSNELWRTTNIKGKRIVSTFSRYLVVCSAKKEANAESDSKPSIWGRYRGTVASTSAYLESYDVESEHLIFTERNCHTNRLSGWRQEGFLSLRRPPFGLLDYNNKRHAI
jgi:hypothetical protein